MSPYRDIDGLPAARSWNRTSFGPMLVPVEKLRTVLRITNVEVRRRKGALAITDTPLAAS